MKSEEESKLKTLIYLLIIVIISILIIVYMFFSPKRGFNINLTPHTENDNPPIPSQLKWHDNFSGINNMKEKKAPSNEEK